MTGPYFGYRGAENYTGLSRRTLSRRLSEISHIVVGDRILFDIRGLDDFLSRHLVQAKPARKTADVGRIVREVGRKGRKAG